MRRPLVFHPLVRVAAVALGLATLGLMWPATAAADPVPPHIPDIGCPPAEPGKTWRVPAEAHLQAALNAAEPGDVIMLAAGATFAGPFTLPNKPGNGPCITIRAAVPDAALPAPGTRMTPAAAAAARLPKILSPGPDLPALRTAPGAHHFQVVGVEILPAGAGAVVTDLVRLGSDTQRSGEVPHHLVFDRVYIHGWPDGITRRGMLLNSAATTVGNSYVSDCKDPRFDSQAVGGWNGPGPFRILNNYLEGASENLIFGGGDPSIPGLVPSDIEIRRNHFAKPPAWMGGSWRVKNLFELKNAQRVLVDANLFEYNWVGSDQLGYAVLFTPRNQDGAAPWSVVRDVVFTNNIVRHSAQGVSVLGTDYNHPSRMAQNIVIKNNLFEDIGGPRWPAGERGKSGTLFEILNSTTPVGLTGGPIALVITNNTAAHVGGARGGAIELRNNPARTGSGLVFANNITFAKESGIVGRGGGVGAEALTAYFRDYVYANNVMVGPWPTPAGARTCDFPQGGPCDHPNAFYYPQDAGAVGFMDYAQGDYRLAETSPYRHAGTDGRDIGVDWETFNRAWEH